MAAPTEINFRFIRHCGLDPQSHKVDVGKIKFIQLTSTKWDCGSGPAMTKIDFRGLYLISLTNQPHT